jgi:hypothetical protein
MSRASAGGTATRRSPRLGCLTASSPARRPLPVGIWDLVAVMSGSGPMHRRCLTMLIDAVHGSRSAPSTEWRTTPTGRDVTALRSQDQSVFVNPHNAAERASSALALRLRCGSCCGSDRAGRAILALVPRKAHEPRVRAGWHRRRLGTIDPGPQSAADAGDVDRGGVLHE